MRPCTTCRLSWHAMPDRGVPGPPCFPHLRRRLAGPAPTTPPRVPHTRDDCPPGTHAGGEAGPAEVLQGEGQTRSGWPRASGEPMGAQRLGNGPRSALHGGCAAGDAASRVRQSLEGFPHRPTGPADDHTARSAAHLPPGGLSSSTGSTTRRCWRWAEAGPPPSPGTAMRRCRQEGRRGSPD